MPELPEAETIARQLARELTGVRLGEVTILRPDVIRGDPRPLGELLYGRRVLCVRRSAKRVILDIEPTTELVFHLGMTGRLRVTSLAEKCELHTHLRIRLADSDHELRFRDPRRFGGVWCLAGASKHVGRRLGPVGLEPLEMTIEEFQGALIRRRQIKALLMDQTAIAGLGNIYCDESLFAARIHPLTQANTLREIAVKRLRRAIISTLQRAIRFNGSTLMDYRDADGREGSFQRLHRVYQRKDLPCRKCGTMIRRALIAGRSTFFCPTCQPRRRSTRKRRL